MRTKPLFLALLAATLSSTSKAADWPNWRGPDHNGISLETGWTANWPSDGPRQLWKFSVGTGFSSMSVSQGRLYTMGNQDDTDTVFCLDAESGKLIWKHSHPCPMDPKMFEGGPGATPTVSDNRVYSFSRNGALFCFDAAAGKVLWSKNLAAETGAEPPNWGFASSPLIQGNSLFLNVGESGLALNKTTGTILWRTGAGPSGYATPVPGTLAGAPALILLARSELLGVRASTGLPLWRFPWQTDFDINVADPIVSGDKVLVSSGYDHGAALLQIHGARVDVIWQNTSLRNVVNSSVLLEGCLYGIDGQAGHSATLKCLDFQTGNVKWDYRGLGSGALIAADKKLIVISDQGELVVAMASPEAFQPISRAQVLGGKCWTSPVLANGRIYCRNARGDVVCLDAKGKS